MARITRRSNGFSNIVTFAAKKRSKVANITSPVNAALNAQGSKMGLLLIPLLFIALKIGYYCGKLIVESKLEDFKGYTYLKQNLINIFLLICIVPIAIGLFSLLDKHFPNGASGFPESYSGYIFFLSPFIFGLIIPVIKVGLMALSNVFKK